MFSRIFILMLLTVGLLTLTGDSCFLESTNVEVPLRGNAEMDFTSVGMSSSDSYEIDFFLELTEIEEDADADVDTLVSAGIENAYWRLIENRGDTATVVTGSINVTRLSTAMARPLIPPDTLTIEEVGTEFVLAPLDSAGINLLIAGFDEYVAYRNDIRSGRILDPPDLRYRFDWVSTGGPGVVDFDWEARIRYILVGVFEVEVPELW
jgi:hypothetical protein